MKFRVAVTVLIIATGTTSWGADNQNQSFRIPDPEEIYEAYENGFIDYQDYLELLEISRGKSVSSGDSIFLMQFPDLLAGISPNPLLNPAEDTVSTEPVEKSVPIGWTQAFLVRQYHQFEEDDRHRQFYRIKGGYHRYSYYGEVERGYTGYQKWGRRSLEYTFYSNDKKTGSCLILGNYKDKFGMGLIYGYHGRLLSKASDRDGGEQFLYPAYGGGNGVLLIVKRSSGDLKLLYDADRNELFAKNVFGVTIPLRVYSTRFALSAVHGYLRNRETDISESSSLVSIFGYSDKKTIQATWEVAVAETDGRIPIAAAMQVKWRRRKVSLNMIGWSYGSRYPSYFSGGPSSRRSQTHRLDDLDLSYSDRYAGETGIVVKTSYPIADRMTLHSAAGCARRGFDDDRIEARIGLKNRLGKHYAAKIDCYWRSDRLYSDIRKQRRIQLEISRAGGMAKNRLVLGYRNEKHNNRDDFLALAEIKILHRTGSLAVLCKFDRLRLNDINDRYMYLTGWYEAKMNGNLSTYVKYTYRYRKGDPGNSYGTIRVDLNWIIQ